jgi:hypothetical protein
MASPPLRRKRKSSDFAEFVATINELTDNGRALIQVAVDIVDGEIEGVSPKDRLDAAKWLASYSKGVPKQQVEVSGSVGHVHAHIDLSKLTTEELLQLDGLVGRITPPEDADVIDVTPEPIEKP